MLHRNKLRFLYVLPCLAFALSVFIFYHTDIRKEEDSYSTHQSRHPLASPVRDLVDCIPAGVDAFPGDFFTQEQRRQGAVVLHFVLLAYLCAMTALICDDHFVPALETISEKLKLSPDVAGATFMAMGASAPELFSSIAGSFITEDDIGVGTIVGSAVFNLLAITGVVGLFLWNEALDVEWYPVARDCLVYSLTVLALFFVISDNIVTWWESLLMLSIFVIYISLMHYNRKLEECSKRLEGNSCLPSCCGGRAAGDRKPLLSDRALENKSLLEPDFKKNEAGNAPDTGNEVTVCVVEDPGSCCSPLESSSWQFVWLTLMYPARLLFTLTIPPIRREGCLRLCFPLTFAMAIAWMGLLSYVAVWMVTIIGYTLLIPDSVAGLTISAAGASVPDLIATVIVARNGFGNMAISNLLGSNTFDLSFCLAAPWFVKTLVNGRGRLLVYSSAMAYTTATLLVTLFSFLLVLRLNRFRLDRRVGMVCLALYATFITLACMFELNVFGEINLPTCF